MGMDTGTATGMDTGTGIILMIRKAGRKNPCCSACSANSQILHFSQYSREKRVYRKAHFLSFNNPSV
jgi:hypothetical protein